MRAGALVPSLDDGATPPRPFTASSSNGQAGGFLGRMYSPKAAAS